MWVMKRLKSFNNPISFMNVFTFFLVLYDIWKCQQIYRQNINKKIKKILRKRAHKRYPNLPKEEKGKNDNMIVNVIKISAKMKNKSLLSLEKTLNEKKIIY